MNKIDEGSRDLNLDLVYHFLSCSSCWNYENIDFRGGWVKSVFVFACAAAIVLASCSRGGSGTGGGLPEPLPEPGPSLTPVFPEGGQARVESREGRVEILRGADILAAAPGTPLALGDRLRTGPDGGVEVSLAGLAGILLLPGSEAELRAARLSPGAAHVEVFVSSGSVLFDVRTLSTGESFVVSTPRTLSGVRGTRFLVTAGNASVTAVREGRVAVLPAGPALGRLASAARTDAAARVALRELVGLAPAAGPGREIRVDEAALGRAEAAYAALESTLAVLPAVPLEPGFPEDLWFAAGLPELPIPDSRVRDTFARARASAAAAGPALAVPVAAGPETLRGFERFRDLRSGPYSSPSSPSPTARQAHPAELGRSALSSRPLAGSLVRVPDTGIFLAADEGGTLSAFGPDGTLRWSLSTAGRGAARTYPVTLKGIAYYSGDAELLAVDGATGSVLARRALEPGRDPGSKPSPFPDSLLLPTPAGIEVLDPRTLETRAVIPVAAGLGTLPVQRDSFALVVDRDGLLMLVDPVTGTVRAQTPTGARGASAVSPRIFEEKACFADRTGLVVMVDLEKMAVLWERRTGVPVLTDLEIAREGVLVFGSGTLFGYRLDGEPLMAPVPGVSSPPLLSWGSVYYGTETGELVAAQAAPWRIRGTVRLDDVPSARPLLVGDTLYVGTRGGKLVRIDVTKLPR